MPPKKKGKANKLARMSEEEKLRYLQHRAAVEEEAKRRKEHIIASYMKDKLKHEEAFTRLNTAKINQQWRQTLRSIKNQELRDASETLRQIFQIALSTKNAIIRHLSRDLKEANKQHCLAVQTHLVAVDKILDIRQNRLNALTVNFDLTKERNLYQSQSERSRLEISFSDDEIGLKTAINCEAINYDCDFDKLEKLGRKHRDDSLHRLMAEMRQMEIEGEGRADKLKKNLKRISDEYLQRMNPIQEQYAELLSSDMKNFDFLRRTDRDVDNCKKLVDKLKLENVLSSDERQNEIDELKGRIDEEKTIHGALKGELKSRRKKGEERLKYLSKVSNDALTDLKSQWEVVKEIRRYSDLIDNLISDEEQLKLDEIQIDDEPTNDDIPLREMTSLWERMGKVEIDLKDLEIQCFNVEDENKRLKELLKSALNTMARPNSVPSSLYRDRVLLKKRPSSGQ